MGRQLKSLGHYQSGFVLGPPAKKRGSSLVPSARELSRIVSVDLCLSSFLTIRTYLPISSARQDSSEPYLTVAALTSAAATRLIRLGYNTVSAIRLTTHPIHKVLHTVLYIRNHAGATAHVSPRHGELCLSCPTPPQKSFLRPRHQIRIETVLWLRYRYLSFIPSAQSCVDRPYEWSLWLRAVTCF